MRRILIAVSTTALLLFFSAGSALAASPHFKHGGEPTCTITSTTTSVSVVCTGSLTGLGNGDVKLVTTISGFAVYECQNKGGNIAPGQNKVLEGPVTVPTFIPGSEVKNGNLTFTTLPVKLSAASTVSGAAAGCPNGNWIGVNPTLTLTSITLTISQGGVLLFTCTATNPDGLTGTIALSC